MLPSQVPGSDDQLGNWSGDQIGMVLIRWKNDLGTLHMVLCIFHWTRVQNSMRYQRHFTISSGICPSSTAKYICYMTSINTL